MERGGVIEAIEANVSQRIDSFGPDVPTVETETVKPGLQLQISERRLLMMAGDSAAIVLSVLLSLAIWSLVGRIPFGLDFITQQAFWFFALLILWFFLAGANDFYNLRLTAHLRTSVPRLLRIEAQLVVIYIVIFFVVSRDALPRLFVLYHAAISFVLIFTWRAWRVYLFVWTNFRRRALIIGTGWTAETIRQAIADDANDDYEVVGFIDSTERAGSQALTIGQVLGTGSDLPAIARRHKIAEVILAHGSEIPGDVFQGIMTCYERGIAVVPMPILYEQITGRVPIEHLGKDHWAILLPIEGRSAFNIYPSIKRLIDIVLALIGLLLFIAILPLLALLMKLDSPGPIFYSQERVGRGGRIFKVIKLRSMIPDAEKGSGPQWAAKDDPRVTRLGRILRKTRLDEVPQVINVLRGEMSVIGPRPERPMFVDQLASEIPFYRTRLAVNPGLTGWAQVSYKYGNTTHDALVKLQYDLYYIRHQSLTLDLLIALRTLVTILAFKGT
jgi:exopolysaccharide biosynthesis polyprenyl glycosylphosphotransferase